jgi:hypothetical protein
MIAIDAVAKKMTLEIYELREGGFIVHVNTTTGTTTGSSQTNNTQAMNTYDEASDRADIVLEESRRFFTSSGHNKFEVKRKR